MSSLLVIALLALIAWFWYDSARAKETATKAAAQACQTIQAQLLDQTVSLKKLSLARNTQGRIAIRRAYNFELSENRQDRAVGRVLLLAQAIESVQLDHTNGTTIL
ncbi:DUF3301 domain-containing protein [Leucothrix sargassi]|nr:DUF3301 domain-containing protein [Leucothrix sargassi]